MLSCLCALDCVIFVDTHIETQSSAIHPELLNNLQLSQSCKGDEMFTYYGHNCFLFETDDAALLIDPWFSRDGAFFGSWFQYPSNHHLNDELMCRVKNKRLSVFISHEHLDHFDIDFVRKINPSTVILPSYDDRYLAKSMISLGFHVQELNDAVSVKISDEIKVRPFISDLGVNHDCALLVETTEGVFFNQNDCKIFDRLGEIDSPIDYYSVQFSGATWHPVCFDYADDVKLRITEKKVAIKLKNVAEGIRKLNPKVFVPAAGPAVFPFLDFSFSEGVDNIFIHQDVLKAFLDSEGIADVMYLWPGESPRSGTIPIPPPTRAQIERSRMELTDVWHDLPNNFNELELVRACKDRLDQIADIDVGDVPILIFSWGDGPSEKIYVDISAKVVRKRNPRGDDDLSPFMEVRAEPKYFSLMHSGYRWQDVYLSLRANISRQPDIFSNFVNMFLFSDVTNIRSAFEASANIKKERCIVKDKRGVCIEIDRFCPHQGADLASASISKDGKLICPRHGWQFDLLNDGVDTSSGECINARLIG